MLSTAELWPLAKVTVPYWMYVIAPMVQSGVSVEWYCSIFS